MSISDHKMKLLLLVVCLICLSESNKYYDKSNHITNKRIVIIRHAEEPTDSIEKKLHPIIGLTLQGALRAYLMPEFTSQIFNGEEFEVHTYVDDDPETGQPRCRAFYTVGTLHQPKV